MIKEFVEAWDARKGEVEAKIRAKHPGDYTELVKWVVEILSVSEDDDLGVAPGLDPERIHVIDDGEYQGTLLFVIASSDYQPWDYWFVRVSYGSCSGCDTLQAIRDESLWGDEIPTEGQVADYMTLALHILQGIKSLGGGDT